MAYVTWLTFSLARKRCPYKVRGKECVPRASPCWPSLCGQLPPDPNLPARAAATARATATMACASATLAGRATTAPPSRSAHTSATCKVSRNRKHENRTAGRGGRCATPRLRRRRASCPFLYPERERRQRRPRREHLTACVEGVGRAVVRCILPSPSRDESAGGER